MLGLLSLLVTSVSSVLEHCVEHSGGTKIIGEVFIVCVCFVFLVALEVVLRSLC
jgi:hypothetical protein